ncbi:Modulator of FtsH protease HflK [BD1-7 clade bacterium]|uniref:Protein HflK n=1 Tax=BD1-7 clade bacterium TaxID=2029982 RepID=A0A5S9N0P6_9GAMM|nr:Modulator of FtsH protease HflK [BD1-7 clade bacterium]CAA0082531.1 Modulator of FtsH protease HflK [BD1-7 clade bacterium]
MAWNEPGGNKNNDPWGGGDQGPPDLDEAFRKFKDKFGGGKGSDGKGGGGKSGGDVPEIGLGLVGVIFVVLILIWAAFGVYQVDQQENAVVLRFGKYHDIMTPGLHWNPPLVDTVQKVNMTRVRSSAHDGMMLTEDDNIVEIDMSVQWTVKDPRDFWLNVRSPEVSLDHAAESALRHAVGGSELHQVLTEGRDAIAQEVQERLQTYLDDYGTGILVGKVNIDDAQPPEQVQAAFDDVIRAKEDESRVKNQAETYRNGIIPEARGLAIRALEEAAGYEVQVVAESTGEAQRFTALLGEYEKAPGVTRERLYLDTMQRVMTNSSKVMVDTDAGSLMYLPLDKLTDGGRNINIDENIQSTFKEIKSRNGAGSASRSSGRTSTRREGR